MLALRNFINVDEWFGYLLPESDFVSLARTVIQSCALNQSSGYIQRGNGGDSDGINAVSTASGGPAASAGPVGT